MSRIVVGIFILSMLNSFAQDLQVDVYNEEKGKSSAVFEDPEHQRNVQIHVDSVVVDFEVALETDQLGLDLNVDLTATLDLLNIVAHRQRY